MWYMYVRHNFGVGEILDKITLGNESSLINTLIHFGLGNTSELLVTDPLS